MTRLSPMAARYGRAARWRDREPPARLRPSPPSGLVQDPVSERSHLEWARVSELDTETGTIEQRLDVWHRKNAASQQIAAIPGVGLLCDGRGRHDGRSCHLQVRPAVCTLLAELLVRDRQVPAQADRRSHEGIRVQGRADFPGATSSGPPVGPSQRTSGRVLQLWVVTSFPPGPPARVDWKDMLPASRPQSTTLDEGTSRGNPADT